MNVRSTSRIGIIGVVLALSLMLVGTAYAQRGSQGNRFGPQLEPSTQQWSRSTADRPMGRALTDLELSTEQQQELKELWLSFEEDTIDLEADLKRTRLGLQRELMADEPDLEKIEGLIDQISDLRAEIQKTGVAYLLEAKEILTDEQLAKLEAHRWEHRSMRGRTGGARGTGWRL